MNSRQQIILQMVIDQGRVSVVDLAKATGVSEVTIRQDLNLLEKQSYLRRAHGYAVPLDSDDVETRMMNNFALKRELAEFAASLVNNGETVFIENGSSNALLARTLADQKDVTIITVSSYIAPSVEGNSLRGHSAGRHLPEEKRKHGGAINASICSAGSLQ